MKLAIELMGQMVLNTESPSRLRAARESFARWASECPDNTALQAIEAAIDVRLKFVGKKKSVAVTISNRAREIAEDLELPANPIILEFLSEAEILLKADGNDSEQTHRLMVQAAWEFASLIMEAGVSRQIQ